MKRKNEQKVKIILMWFMLYILQFQVCFTHGNEVQNVTGVTDQSGTPSYYFLVEGDGLRTGYYNLFLLK